MNQILILILLTLTPFLELRASIPYGIFNTGLSYSSVFIICVLANILLAPILYWFFNNIIHLFLHIKVIDKLYQKTVIRTQRKVHKYIERYGILGLAVFIGIPLPGSGVYTGALAAYLLGFKFKEFLYAAILGVLIAGTIVFLVSTLGSGLWTIFIKV